MDSNGESTESVGAWCFLKGEVCIFLWSCTLKIGCLKVRTTVIKVQRCETNLFGLNIVKMPTKNEEVGLAQRRRKVELGKSRGHGKTVVYQNFLPHRKYNLGNELVGVQVREGVV